MANNTTLLKCWKMPVSIKGASKIATALKRVKKQYLNVLCDTGFNVEMNNIAKL